MKKTTYTDEFKKQIVQLCNNGKTVNEVSKEYSIPETNINRWKREYKTSGSFKASDNRSDEENKLIALEKELKQLRMENDILKQAALIMGRK